MKRNELLTFFILAFNFLIIGMVTEREGFLANDIYFAVISVLGAYALTKYVFYVSKKLNNSKKGDE